MTILSSPSQQLLFQSWALAAVQACSNTFFSWCFPLCGSFAQLSLHSILNLSRRFWEGDLGRTGWEVAFPKPVIENVRVLVCMHVCGPVCMHGLGWGCGEQQYDRWRWCSWDPSGFAIPVCPSWGVLWANSKKAAGGEAADF